MTIPWFGGAQAPGIWRAGSAPAAATGPQAKAAGAFRRETFRLPRVEARAKAREWFDLYPKAAYMTEIEFWRVCEDGDIEFTIRRLPTAD